MKSLLVISSSMMAFLAMFWGGIYIYFDEITAGLIPLCYSLLTFLSICIFAYTGRYRVFRFTQLLLSLLLPLFLSISLGGFINSSGVVLWSFTSPLGALLFSRQKHALKWFHAYLVIVAGSGFIDSHVYSDNGLPDTLITIFFVMNIVGTSMVGFVLLYYFVYQKDRAFQLLNLERNKSEKLLLNVLPRSIAMQLRGNHKTIAEHYPQASVLFADVVGFTPMTADLAPEVMVERLNSIFSRFDTLVDKYDLEKIRNIGDNYMVASGVPSIRHDHAQALARLALEMVAITESDHEHESNIRFRLGINSGPVIGGVIGRKKFSFDIWGEVVNTASRMESHGIPGRIQVTQATYEILKSEFLFERRGRSRIKGIGEMETWFLLKERP
jgi:guanylate cyclase